MTTPNLALMRHGVQILHRLDTQFEEFNLNDWKVCACGHFTRDAVFQAAGLRRIDETPTYGKQSGFYAISALFGISYADAVFMFCMRMYNLTQTRDPLAVADRMQAFINYYTPARGTVAPKLEPEVAEASARGSFFRTVTGWLSIARVSEDA